MRIVDLTHSVDSEKPQEIRVVLRSAMAVDCIPLDRLVTLATVVDLGGRGDPDEVTRADTARHGIADIAGCVLRTGWSDERLSGRTEKPPVLSVDAAAYLLEGGVKVVAADFPLSGAAAELLLRNDCVLIYCLSNLSGLRKRIVRLVALPLKLAETHTAQARAIAIEE